MSLPQSLSASAVMKTPRILNLIQGPHLLIFLTAMVILHLCVMVAYTQYSKQTENELNRDEVIEEMVSMIEVAQTYQGQEREEALSKLYYPHLIYTISNSPASDLQIRDDAYWQLEKKLHDRNTKLSVSYQLPSGNWLNLTAHIKTNALEMQLFLIILELVVAVALLFSAWSVARFTGPLKHFKLAAERLGVDLHSESISVYGPSIVRETANAMNQMQKRIQNLLSNRTQMLAAISHDLRTPITRLKLRAQFISAPEEYEKTINDLDEMEKMISQILSFAKAEFENEEKVKLDLQSLLVSICDEMQDMGHDAQYIGTLSRVTFYGRTLALKRAFTNVVNNAIKYGQHVQVNLQYDNDLITILVRDDGPGIPENELEQVFDPFYRTDRARSSNTGGVGLGLAVTLDIIRAHSGKIILSNNPEGGLTTRITFKRLKSL